MPVRHTEARAADYQGVDVSSRLAKELLDWSPVTSFPTGVRQYLDWLDLAEAMAVPATTGPATTGPATTGPATTGPATSGPATSGPATSGPVTAGEQYV